MGSAILANGRKLPLMGFGTFRITDKADVFKSLDCALSVGYRLIDTALFYKNEHLIGDALQTLLPKHGLRRADVFLTTKLSPMDGERVEQTVRKQLADLQTDAVDLMLIHTPGRFSDPKNPNNRRWRRETWLELERLRDAGLCEGIGVSNYEIRHLEEMSEYAASAPLVNQCEFHPHFTRRPLLDHCRRVGVHFQAFTSLGRNEPRLMDEATLADVARAHSASVSQVLLAFALCQGVSVIPKSTHDERIRDNFAASKLVLSEEELASIARLNRDQNYTQCMPWLVV